MRHFWQKSFLAVFIVCSCFFLTNSNLQAGGLVQIHDGTEAPSYFTNMYLAEGGAGGVVPERYYTVADIVNPAVNYLIWGAGLVFFALILVSGYKMIFLPDKERSWTSSRQNLTTGIAGLAIVFIAYWIVQIVLRLVGYEVGGF